MTKLLTYSAAILKLKVPGSVLIIMKWLPRLRLVIFNIVLLDFGFYATHAAMHFNYFPSSQIAMLCLTLIVLDILEMVDICFTTRLWALYLKSQLKTTQTLMKTPTTSRPITLAQKIAVAKTTTLSHINPADSSQGYSSGD